MSRALPSPPHSSLTLSQLQALAADPDHTSIIDLSPREWFDRARHQADLAVLAERKGKKEDMFLAYTRAVAAYTNTKMHPDFGAAKKGDLHWAVRVKEYKVTYEAFLTKAKETKEALKHREIEGGSNGRTPASAAAPTSAATPAFTASDTKHPSPTSSVAAQKPVSSLLAPTPTSADAPAPSSSSRPPPAHTTATGGPEVTSMGSIADRMRALRGKGMDVGEAKRVGAGEGGGSSSGSGHSSAKTPTSPSTPMTPAVPAPAAAPAPPSLKSGLANMSVTGGAGDFGPARTASWVRGSSSAAPEPHHNPKPAPTPAEEISSASIKRKPSIPPKPTHPLPHISANGLPTPPSSVPDEKSVRPTATGSSTRSGRSMKSNGAESDHTPVPMSPHISGDASQHNLSPAHSGPSLRPSASGPSTRTGLPTISQSVVSAATPTDKADSRMPPQSVALPASGPAPALSPGSGINEFEKAFPSLSEFGKQFEPEELSSRGSKITGLPISSGSGLSGRPDSNGHRNRRVPAPVMHEDDEPSFPELPSFPVLPSVPSAKPGLPKSSLPPPPARPADLEPDTENSSAGPPSPGIGRVDMSRPASSPNVSTLPGDIDLITGVETAEAQAEDREPPPAALRPAPPPAQPIPNGSTLNDPRSPPLSFPTAKPTPPAASTSIGSSSGRPRSTSSTKDGHMQLPAKPKFPFANSVEPDVLRSYILNPSVDLLLLDARSAEDFQKGHVGKEYESKGYPVQVVWMDPTVLLRSEMTSSKLEDSLSLSPEGQRRAFDLRNKADLVVVYDSHSVNWPKKGSAPTPLSRLWDIIYEHEFAKRLERTPVMLTGGYEAWTEFVKLRQARHHAGANGPNGAVQRGPYNSQGLLNGFERMAQSPRPGDRSSMTILPSEAKRSNRDMPVYQPAHYAKNITDSFGYGPQSMTGETSYTGHQSARPLAPPSSSHRPTHSPSGSISSYTAQAIPPPPQASIHPGPGARRRSDYVEQHNQVYSGYPSANGSHASGYDPAGGSGSHSPRPTIDYPQAHALGMGTIPHPQPPPPAQSHALEKHEQPRPTVVRSASIRALDLVAGGDEVRYWNDVALGLTGLKNLGNTCYMNSTLQCLSSTYPFSSFFLDGSYKKAINLYNPLGTKGNLANAFSELLKALWKEDYTFLSPVTFRKNIIGFAPQFSGSDQHDSQEFLSFVLDGLHEDLNRVKHKPPPIDMSPEREAALETLPPEVASEKEWQIYRMRNDSFIVDLFQGQYRNRLECLTCHKTSTTYDAFMYMSLPVPAGKKGVVVQELIDEFVRAEVMEGEDAWHCPRCKVPRRATKTLTVARLPPVLLIQLKRFSTQDGVFWNKSETPVIFPVNGLDLTRHVPRRHSTGREDLDDPRTQIGPFKYDLYGVSNHMGTLSSGHYTAFVKSSKGWMYCEDSKITKAQEKDVVSKPAYILFYKRVRV